jgi:hypothetical protein
LSRFSSKRKGGKSQEQAESQVAEPTVRPEVKKEKIPESEERRTKDVSEIASKEDEIFQNLLYQGHLGDVDIFGVKGRTPKSTTYTFMAKLFSFTHLLLLLKLRWWIRELWSKLTLRMKDLPRGKRRTERGESSMRGETLRNMLYKGHPPYCTCVECTRRRPAKRRVSDGTAVRKGSGNKGFAGSRAKVAGTKAAKGFFLFVLILVCVAVVLYTGYLLYEHKINPPTGGAILLISISALIWNVSLLRKYRVGFGSLFASFVFVALICSTVCAFADIEPFAEAKQRVVEFVKDMDLFGQPELAITIVRFEQGKLADEIVFFLSVSETEKTVEGVIYTIEILGNGLILGSTDVSTVGDVPDFTPVLSLFRDHPLSGCFKTWTRNMKMQEQGVLNFKIELV